MKLKRDTKFGEVSTHHFKIDIRNMTKFDPSARKSKKKFILMDSFWAKYILFELKMYRGINNLSWNWRGIQNLERNHVVVSKLA